MFDSLVWSFSLPGLSLVNSMPKVSVPQLTLVCACVILPCVDGLVLEDFVSAGNHCGGVEHVCWSVVVGAWLARLAHHDFRGCGIFVHDLWWWLARSLAMLLDCAMLGLWLDPQFLSVVLRNMFSVSCACLGAGLRRGVVFPEAWWCRHFQGSIPSAHWNGEFFASHRQF